MTAVWPGWSRAPSTRSTAGGCASRGGTPTPSSSHPDRLTTPLIRKNGKLQPASWEEALTLVAARLRQVQVAHGPDSVMFLSSAKATNEENYLLMKLARAVFGTNNVDHCARLCHASTVVGLAETFGSGAMTNSIACIDEAEVILVTGSNTTEQHPLIGARILEAQRRGARLIVADSRRIRLARQADLHLRHRNGTDVPLFNAMLHVILGEGLEDREFLAARTEGLEELRQAVAELDAGTRRRGHRRAGGGDRRRGPPLRRRAAGG